MNDDVITRLRAAADSEMLPPRPVDELIQDARRRRTRHRLGAVTGGLASVALVSSVAVLAGLPLPGRSDDVALTAPRPTRPVTSAPPTSNPPAVDPTDRPRPSGTGAGTAPAAPTTSTWPAPPTTRLDRPWLHPGHDYGRMVGARHVNGDIVITVDRVQIYTREEWRRRTGDVLSEDFRTVNSSTRTRDFVVEPDALVHLSDQFIRNLTGDHLERIEARELVARTTAALERQKADGAKNPGVTVWLFHRGGTDGPVTYVEDAAVTVG